MEQEVVEKLNESVDKLNKNIERQTSFKFIVLRGLVYGISIVIGTTILAGIFISFLDDVPVVENVINEYQTPQ
jgi:hypothetical protein